MKKLFLLTIIWLYTFCCIAQNPANYVPSRVLHYTINIDSINFIKKYINANAVVKTIAQNDNKFCLMLNGLTVKTVYYRAGFRRKLAPFKQIGEYVIIKANDDFQQGDTVDLEINYHGFPKSNTRWGGFFFKPDGCFNMGVAMSSFPHSAGRFWYPANDMLTNKATYNINITVPNNYVAVCTGSLCSRTAVDNNKTKYEWSIERPIPSYLAAIAINKYSRMVAQFGKTPIEIWYKPYDSTAAAFYLNKMPKMLEAFEHFFTPYRWNKAGLTEVDFPSGAMEHAENIFFPSYAFKKFNYNETMAAHEIAHSWFGNLATCKTYGDMWLNEAFATYCETLYLEYAYGKDSAKFYQAQKHNDMLDLLLEYEYEPALPISGIDSLHTYSVHTYQKGQSVINALRYYVGDKAFFSGCKNYIEKYAYKNASAEDFKHEIELTSNKNLSDFFNFYFYGKGFVKYQNTLLDVKKQNKEYITKIKINQQLYQTKDYNKANKLDIMIIGENSKSKIDSIEFTNKDTTVYISTHFQPVDVITNPFGKACEASITFVNTISQKGNYVFPNTELQIVNINKQIIVSVEKGYSNNIISKKDQNKFQQYYTIKTSKNDAVNANISLEFPNYYGLNLVRIDGKNQEVIKNYKLKKTAETNIFTINLEKGTYTIAQ